MVARVFAVFTLAGSLAPLRRLTGLRGPPSVVATAMATDIAQLDLLFQEPAIRLSDARVAELVRGHGATH
jgi:hypothetical protein